MSLFTVDTIICQRPGQMVAEVNSELMIFSEENGEYYNLDAIAADILSRLAAPVRVGAMIEGLVADYQAAPEEIQADTMELLATLLEKKIIEIIDTPSVP